MCGRDEQILLNIFWDTFIESVKKKSKKISRSATGVIRKKPKIRQFYPSKIFILIKFDHLLTLRAHCSGSESDMNANDIPK